MNTNNLSIYIVLIIGFFPILYWSLICVFKLIIAKAKKDKLFRNHLLSFTYMIINLGPNVSAFSIVSLVSVSTQDTKVVLLLIFIMGLLLNYYGRKIRNYMFEKTKVEIPGFKKSDYTKAFKGVSDGNCN